MFLGNGQMTGILGSKVCYSMCSKIQWKQERISKVLEGLELERENPNSFDGQNEIGEDKA